MLLLHGGGLSWWNYREAAELLSCDFRVVLPILDGHADSGERFTTIEDCAARVVSLIKNELGGSVWLIGGLSLGGQTALEVLSQQPEISRFALIESASVIPSPVTHAMIAPAFGCSYPLIKNERFARMQFRSLHMKDELFGDYYRDSCRIEKDDMIAFLRASTAYSPKPQLGSCPAVMRVYFGEREVSGIRRSAKVIGETVPGCRVTGLKGLYHGEFSMAHAEGFAAAVRSLTAEKEC